MPLEGESEPPLGSTRELSTRVMDTHPRVHVPSGRRPLPPLPLRIDRFRPIEVLGRGGMGVVYRAVDPRLDRTVALKLLTAYRDDHDAQQRLRREAQALAQLSDPNVVQVFDSGVFHGKVFIAMELVPGQSLREWVRHAPRSVEAIVEAYLQAGAGLAAAHGRGIIHRDFKPDNAIMGDDGRVRVLDFGLARADAGPPSSRPTEDLGPAGSTAPWPSILEQPLTASGAVMGTPVYMAPEVHQGQPASPTSDQFALCVSLYEALYGQRPFEGARLHELVGHMLRNELRAEPADTKLPPSLRAVIVRGLRADPNERWPSMDALLTQLRRRTGRRPWRRWAPTLVLSLGGIAVVVATRPVATPCSDSRDGLAGVWDDASRLAVRRSLLRDSVPYAAATLARVESQLDGYAEHWLDAHQLACASPRRDDTLDQRMRCLGRRRQGLAALVELLADPSQHVLVQAVSLVGELGDVDECLLDAPPGAAASLAPKDAAEAHEVEQLREQLARIAARQGAGQYDEAARQAMVVLAAAEALGHAPLVAEAALRDGVAHYKAGDIARAGVSLERAYFVAAELGYDEIAGEASSWLVYVHGVGLGDLEAATRWAEHALAATEGRNQVTKAFALSGLGMVFYEQGDEARARELFEQELAILELDLDPLDVRLASTLNRVGMVLAEEGLHDEALAHQQRALALWERAVGPDHPKLAAAYHYRALAYEHRGDYELALRDGRRSLEIWERALGPDHPEVGGALANLGVLLRAMDRTEEALQSYRRALACWEAALGPEHLRVASLQLNIGYALADLGDREGALAAFRVALRLREQALGPSHPQTVVAREALDERLVEP